MKARGWLLTAAVMLLGLTAAMAAQQSQPSAPDRLTVTIDAAKTAEPVSPYLYGGFIEHIGTLIYRSLWSEMIDDRKFYFPISSKSAEQPESTSARPARMPVRKWQPVGPDAVVVMDKDRPFVGDQSPRIELEGSAPHGIRQSGLTLVKGKQYTGRIYLRGTSGSQAKVALIWGPGENERQTVPISGITSDYKKFPFSFTAKADSNEGVLEITGTGTGNLHIGTVSLMPADNVQGFRPDTTAQLRQLRAGMWRLPGGNFLSDWSWYDSVGDIDRRPPMLDDAWHAMQTNDVGMDEFMTLCKLIGVDPYITVNAGFGDAHSAAEEVEYMNGAANTRLGAMRARNGHPEPYHVKFWDIGNEPYGKWQHGHTDLKYYVLKHNEFAKAMRKADPSITLLASGAMPDEMTVEGQSRAMHLDPQAQFGSEADWTGGLLAHSWGNFDGLTEHWYSRAGKRFDYEHAKSLPADAPNEAGYVPVEETLLEWVRHPSNRVAKKAEEWREYEKRFPAMADKKIFLSIDEYSYSGAAPGLKSAMAYAMVLNEMFRHTDFMKAAALTMGLSALDYNNNSAILNTTGLLYKMYRDQFGTLPVDISGNSPQPAPKYPPYGDQPKINAGSPTYPLDMVAALTDDHKFLTVAVVNATETEQKFDLTVTGARVAGPSKVWRMTGKSVDAANHVGQPQQVDAKELPAGNTQGAISVAPISISVYRFPL
ncbi:MAG: alpha-N-arabinofuranosidase [Bryobacteraceae bacterium]